MNLPVRTAHPLVAGNVLSAVEQDRISRAMLALFAAALAVAIPVAAAALLIPASVASSRIGLLDCLVAELVIAGKSTNTYFSGNPFNQELRQKKAGLVRSRADGTPTRFGHTILPICSPRGGRYGRTRYTASLRLLSRKSRGPSTPFLQCCLSSAPLRPSQLQGGCSGSTPLVGQLRARPCAYWTNSLSS